MKTIWKFPIPIRDDFSLIIPQGAEVLCVQVQGDEPCIWAAVDTDAERELRMFSVRGTGHPLGNATPDDYIGTFQVTRLGLVFHVFEAS